jgi:hypothetical protein
MASTLTLQAEAPGKGGWRKVDARGSRPIGMAVYKIAFGNPYVVGGESISAIWDDFADVLAIVVQQVDVTAADRREFMVDLTNKKLLVYDAFNTEETATDQSAVADVRLLVFGYRK